MTDVQEVKLDPKQTFAMEVMADRGIARASTTTTHDLRTYGLPSVRGNVGNVLIVLGLVDRIESGACFVLTKAGWEWLQSRPSKVPTL